MVCRCAALHCLWAQVEAEAVPEVSAKLEIAMVPTFVLVKVQRYSDVFVARSLAPPGTLCVACG